MISGKEQDEMRKKYKTIIVVSIILVVVTLCALYIYASYMEMNEWTKPRYASSYYGLMGINRDRAYYSEIVASIGEPKSKEIRDDGRMLAYYDHFILRFEDDSDEAELLHVTVTDNTIRFGKKEIGIGSTKKEVEKAYRRVLHSPDGENIYVDNYFYVEYSFDENDIVSQIDISQYWVY